MMIDRQAGVNPGAPMLCVIRQLDLHRPPALQRRPALTGDSTMRCFLIFALFLLALPASAAPSRLKQFGVPALPRIEFNRLAIQAGSPLFWVADRNTNGLIEPDELAGTGRGTPLLPYVQKSGEGSRGAAKGQFTPRFITEYKALVELRRREAVAHELDGGRPTLVATDLSALPPAEKAMLKQILDAAFTVEELYLHQTGGFSHWKKSAKLDPASKSLFWRNHGPWCTTPGTRNDPFCNGSPEFPDQRSEAYPLDVDQGDAFCKLLASQENSKKLLDPFTVVQRSGKDKFVAVTYERVWGKKMSLVAARLKAAAMAIAKVPEEQHLFRYLMAASKGFLNKSDGLASTKDNPWSEADRAYVAMNSDNSKWYLRVAPDEVYYDPCQQKAGFQLSLARIDQKSRHWQRMLTPIRGEFEQALAALIGPPYKARKVEVHMPDFIEIVMNAGDARHPLGGAIGESLPNWGPVVQEGHGRTVVMSNLYTDEDSRRIFRLQAGALLSKASMTHYPDNAGPKLLGIVLHEATHNFGPYTDYIIQGKSSKQIFSGELASTLEELKAQNGSLWFLQLLKRKKLIDDKFMKQAYTDSIAWAFGHISRGMFTPGGQVQPYSQLAAVQIGFFSEEGALTFKDGKFDINYEKLPAAVEKLMKRVGQIKAKGDAKAGQELVDRFVKGKGRDQVHQAHIAKELLRWPKATFVYSVTY
jgi:hypothetical protein